MRLAILILFLLGTRCLTAQEIFAYIDSISIEGNKTTRDKVILRELKFNVGDTISTNELGDILEQSENLVLNTGVFHKVVINIKNWEGSTNKVHILITVWETWFIYPSPILELVDRNFNVWWTEHNRSLERINFGLDFAHLNFTGRRDKLKFTAKYGYTRKYSMQYRLPFIDKEQKWGIFTDFSFSRNRELNYLTVNNKQEFYKDEERFIRDRFKSELGLTYRPKLLALHTFIVRFWQNRVDDIVATELNPDYFLNSRTLQRYFTLAYHYRYDTRDFHPYPTKGYQFEATIEKDGFGIFGDRDALTLTASYAQYIPLATKWSMGFRTKGKYSVIRSKQPYNDNRALGFGRDFLRGYEFYLMDGLDMAMLKSSVRFRLFKTEMTFGKLVPIKAFRTMPVKAFLSLNNDFGFVNAPFERELNPMHNRLLWGGGIGLDIVLYYDKVIQINYSFNHLWENGLFLQLNLAI